MSKVHKKYELFTMWVMSTTQTLQEVADHFEYNKEYSKQLIRSILREYFNSKYFHDVPTFAKEFATNYDRSDGWYISVHSMPWKTIEAQKEFWNKIVTIHEEDKGIDPSKATLDTELRRLPLSTRTLNSLKLDEIYTLRDLIKWTPAELLKIPNLGRKGINEIRDLISKSHHCLKEDVLPAAISGEGIGTVNASGNLSLNFTINMKEGDPVKLKGYLAAPGLRPGVRIKITLEVLED